MKLIMIISISIKDYIYNKLSKIINRTVHEIEHEIENE